MKDGKVKVRIRSLQQKDGKKADFLLETDGELITKNQKKYIRYTEVDEEGHETKNRLVIDASEIHLKKSGQNVFDMRFAKEVESAGIYETPYGSFATVITTTEIAWEEADTEIQVALDYSLEMQNAHVADCHMDIRICES